MSFYDFRDHFNLVPLGPLTSAGAATAFPDADGPPTFNGVPQNVWSVVNEASALNGRACRAKYPAGSFGEKTMMAIFKNGPGVASNLEMKFRFNTGFVLNPDPAHLVSGGKIAMSLDLNDPFHGMRTHFWWLGDGSNFARPPFTPVVQQNTSPSREWIQPQQYSAPIVVGQTYTLRMQSFGGLQGFSNLWLDGNPIGSASGDWSVVSTANGRHWYRFIAFAGGASSAYAPPIDCFTDMWDIHIYTEGTPPPPVGGPVSTYPAPPFPSNMNRVLFRLAGANFNTTADQPMQQVGYLGQYRINKISILNPSTSLTTAAGGFYTGAGKTGITLVSAGQTYAALTNGANGHLMDCTLGSGAMGNVFTQGTFPIFALTTPQGGAATADIEIEGTDLT